MTDDEKHILRIFHKTGGGRTLDQLETEARLPKPQFEAALASLIEAKLIDVAKTTVVVITLKPSERGWQTATTLRRKILRTSVASASGRSLRSQEQNDQ